MKFLNVIFWEFVQNVPVIVLFMAAVWLWAKRSKTAALACIGLGAALGALVIRFTESLKLMSDYMEPVSVTLVNIVMFGLLPIPFVIYLGSESRWSNWKTDLALGGLAGACIALAQGLAAPGSLLVGVILHTVSLTLAGCVVLVSIRTLKGKSLPVALAGSVLIVVAMTLVISIIDYGYVLIVG